MKNLIIFIGIIAATIFVGCTNKVSKSLHENNMLRDTLSTVEATSKIMTYRKSTFNIPKTDLSVMEETRIYNNSEENNVLIKIESNKKRENLYEEEFSIRNLKELYADIERLTRGGYFHVVSLNSNHNSINCYVRHRIEDNCIEVVAITPEKRYVIESYLINLGYPPIRFLTEYSPPVMIEEERKDRYLP